jgi:hemolysin activation/secretion protein
VIGIRGVLPVRLAAFSYDLFVGMPIYKPDGFPSARATVGVQATAQF